MSKPTRASSALRPVGSLTGYPRTRARATVRAHDVSWDPWWFASDPGEPELGGRFDLPAPEGTCYVAANPSVAVRERLGKEVLHGWVTDDALWHATAVSTLDPADRPEADGRLANAKSSRAADFHTSELNDATPYATTREYARAFRAIGMTGVRYRARFSTGDRDAAEGWFGPAGAPDPSPPSQLLAREEWESRVGLKVAPTTLDAAAIRLQD